MGNKGSNQRLDEDEVVDIKDIIENLPPGDYPLNTYSTNKQQQNSKVKGELTVSEMNSYIGDIDGTGFVKLGGRRKTQYKKQKTFRKTIRRKTIRRKTIRRKTIRRKTKHRKIRRKTKRRKTKR